jgi:hypothetical protein
MSTAQIRSAFVNELGNLAVCTTCTMQYQDQGKTQLLRFYLRRPGGTGEEVVEARVPRGESLIAAARDKAKELKNAQV